MVSAGDVIENPVSGERITFVRTSEQTGGALAEMVLELSPTAVLVAEHIHRSQGEKFQVLNGQSRVTFTPGAGIEQFFDEFFRLAREGRVNDKGMPSLPITARLGLAHDMYLAGPPVPLQRGAFRVLTHTSRLLPRSGS